MSNYESGMGSGRDMVDPAASEQGMGATEGYSAGGADQGLGASQGYQSGAPEQGVGASEGYSAGAPEQGMGRDEGGYLDRTNEQGMGSGRANDEKEGKVGKMFDKVKERLTRPHEENK
jgi:hypothetical protein